jgi:opacity protein-like surface antigen
LRSVKYLCLALGILAAAAQPAASQELLGRWGVGGFVAYNKPLFTFGDRWDGNAQKWGINLSYVTSSRVTMEVEYHNAKLDDGILERQPFVWGATLKEYRSREVNADSRYTMSFNSLLMSAVVHFRRDRSMEEGSFSPYVVVGAGFYDHNAEAENIIWPGQNEADAVAAGGGVDADGLRIPAVVMATQSDTRTALAMTFGFGLEAFLTKTIAIDTRLRYHFLMSELRPYDAFLLNKVFPLQMMDLTAGFKFYFWD